MLTTSTLVHWFKITVKTRMGGEIVEKMRWDNMRFDIRIKYDWYFKYRAAVLQVKYPKYFVDTKWGHAESEGIHRMGLLDNKIRAKKAKITSITNRLRLAEKNWNELFAIADDRFYKQALEKLERLKGELKALIIEQQQATATPG